MEYLGLSQESIIILGVVILADIITGVLRSAVVHGWKSLTSSKLSAGVLAKSLLIFVPILLALAGKGVGVDLTSISGGALNVLILSQVYSVFGNIHSIQTKGEKSEFDALSVIMRSLRDVLERYLSTPKK